MKKLFWLPAFIVAAASVRGDGNIVFNEISPIGIVPGAEFVEFYNTSTGTTFNVGGWSVDGLGYTFPAGTMMAPHAFLVLTKNRNAFTNSYGPSPFDQFPGDLSTNGEVLTLFRPGATTNDPPGVAHRVKYENGPPWSVGGLRPGDSLQVIDSDEDSGHQGNWANATSASWHFVSFTSNIGVGNGGGVMRLVLYIGPELGSAIIDDVSLVAGTIVPGEPIPFGVSTNNGVIFTNYVRNGDFESPLTDSPPLTNSWMVGTNYTNSSILNRPAHSGNGALRLIADNFGNSVIISGTTTNNKVIYQALSPAPPINSTNTLSFWFLAANTTSNVTVRVINSPALNPTTNINVFGGSSTVPTPGATNQAYVNLPRFPSLWINKVQAGNISSFTDSAGEHDPWIEIYNAGSNGVVLTGLYLSSTYTNLTNWVFPNFVLGATQSLRVFCDGQPAQTTNLEFHTSFRLPPVSGSIALSRVYAGEPQVIDYANYSGLSADHSFRSVPDGQPFFRQDFFHSPLLVSQNPGILSLNSSTHLGQVTIGAGINPQDLMTTATLQYGLTTLYGAVAPASLAASSTDQPVNFPLALAPGFTWHYRIVAANAAGIVTGPDNTITVSSPGDFNADGVVSQAELDSVYSSYLSNSPWLYLTNVAGLGGTNVTFALSNSTAGAYSVEYSTNLTNWIFLGPAIPRYLFNDTNAPASPQRYYRLRWP